MTVAPLIAMKSTKCESLEAVGKELDRRAHTYANDVDQSGRHVGYLCRAGDDEGRGQVDGCVCPRNPRRWSHGHSVKQQGS